ncbi:PREDICTED: uncharacterized protein LOC109351673 isoform X2 [Lupinus angustifolius]|uniref:uncharacterized protein LOC109351672 isoform X2 n=1 Tax=Lupinus angustifolius TaxID=3871 RepID=UPI00092F4F40|nr:PREDICTED: uncharacterized protein LOC109351672 isoform X2 [Lupinus angustifolius]XP_019448768.1 PREDICTED: uncharacterized protein LOC109351673 isoform X2 [Lupinus angustifolius]
MGCFLCLTYAESFLILVNPDTSLYKMLIIGCESSSPSLYQNVLQDIFKSSSISAHASELASLQESRGILGRNASESVLYHPSYGNQANMWTNQNSFNDKMVNGQQNVFSDSSNPQGSSLSLSSNSQSNHPSCSQFEFEPQSPSGILQHVKSFQDSIPMRIPFSSVQGTSSSTLFYNSKEDIAVDGGDLSSFYISSRPECQMNKANILFMQEEEITVCSVMKKARYFNTTVCNK